MNDGVTSQSMSRPTLLQVFHGSEETIDHLHIPNLILKLYVFLDIF